MAEGAKNYTFTLPVEVVEKLRQYVRMEEIPSMNAGVREAIEEYTTRLDRERFRREMQSAGRDASFLADLAETMRDFANSDSDAENIKRTED